MQDTEELMTVWLDMDYNAALGDDVLRLVKRITNLQIKN